MRSTSAISMLGSGKELFRAAIASRLMIGAARVWQEYPTHNHNPNQTDTQKQDAFLERIFVEFGGTGIQIASLYAVPDVVSKILMKHLPSGLKLDAAHLQTILTKQNLSPAQSQKAVEAIAKAYGNANGIDARNPIIQQLYDAHGVWDRFNKATSAVKHDPVLYKAVNKVLSHYHRTLWRTVGGTLVGAVLISAVLSGYVTQYLNDYIYNPRVIPWLKKSFNMQSNSQPAYERVNYRGPLALATNSLAGAQ